MRLANLVSLPSIIKSPGQYRTRCGDTVTVTRLSTGLSGGWAFGYYDGSLIQESWDVSGRILPFTPTQNDIVSPLQPTI